MYILFSFSFCYPDILEKCCGIILKIMRRFIILLQAIVHIKYFFNARTTHSSKSRRAIDRFHCDILLDTLEKSVSIYYYCNLFFFTKSSKKSVFFKCQSLFIEITRIITLHLRIIS